MEKHNEKRYQNCSNLDKVNNNENNLDNLKKIENENNINTLEKEILGNHKGVLVGEERRTINLRPRNRAQKAPSTMTSNNSIVKPSSEETEQKNYLLKPDSSKTAGYHEDVIIVEERRIIKLRPRNRTQKAPSTITSNNSIVKPSSDEYKQKNNLLKPDMSKTEMNNSFASVGLSKFDYNVTLDPNIVDQYTNVPVSSLPDAPSPPPESPETKRKRIEQETLKIAKQCRLHPSNKQYNRGPVVNPPLISPGVVVGYTPAGQRHQVDLNFERPTWFNSEYARRQFDDATRINVSRMLYELENGRFLPNSLDPDIERRHSAERELARREAEEYFETCVSNCEKLHSDTDLSVESEDYMSILETEQQLIELNEFAVVKIQDFSEELVKRLNNALQLKITPLMIIKNPIILETIETLCNQRLYSNVVRPAQALLNKIKSLFDVPFSQTFKQYFASEVDRLKENTKHTSSFDILMMTEEPAYKSNESSAPPITPEAKSTESDPIPVEVCEQQNESEEEWIPVENGDNWVDVNESETDSNDYRPISPPTVLQAGGDTVEHEESDSEESLDISESYSNEESETDFGEDSEFSIDEEDLLADLVHEE